jgi:hypothetical protein
MLPTPTNSNYTKIINGKYRNGKHLYGHTQAFHAQQNVHKAAPSEGGCCTTRVGCSSVTNIGTLQCLWFLVIVHLMQRKPNVSALSHGLLCLSPRRTEGTSLKSIKLGFLLTRTAMMSIHLGTIIAARPPVYML